MAKISIIIPVYNAEKYLNQCIQSILKQSFTDFELLLINDGSKDKSGEICDRYSANDIRVRVFHKNNCGVSASRNLGLRKANGEWVTFIDSDDFISENYFQPIFEFEKQDYIIMNSYSILDDLKSIFRSYESKRLGLDEFLNQYNLFRDFGTPWGKFFRNAIIFENKIVFDEKLNKGEDVLFNLTYILICKTVGISNSTAYNYRRDLGGLSSKKNEIFYLKYLYELLYNKLKEYSNNAEFISKHISYCASEYFLTVLSADVERYKKRMILLKLIKRHKIKMIESLKYQRINLVPLKWLISFELINLTLWLGTLKKNN